MSVEPNFLIIGANKAGTTSLYHYLKVHPDIFMSNIKEPLYFANREHESTIYDRNWCHGATNKTDLLKKMLEGYSGEKWFGEASTMYAGQADYAIAPNGVVVHDLEKRIQESQPNMKFIYVLRHPMDRMLSQYAYAKKTGSNTPPFNVAVHEGYLEKSLYFFQLERYLKCFPRANLKILIFEEFLTDIAGTLTDIFRFLDIEEIDLSGEKFIATNQSPRNDNDTFSLESFEKLIGPITEDVAKMEQFLGRSLNWDLEIR